MDKRVEARALRCRTRVLDATKQNISRLEKEMTEISKKLEIVFADAVTDQVKKYVEELGRRLQSQAGEKGQMKDSIKEIRAQPKHVVRRDPNTSSSTRSSLNSFKDMQKLTQRIRDGNDQSSIASSTQTRIQEILTQHEENRNGSPTASSSKDDNSTAPSSKADMKKSKDGSSTASSSKDDSSTAPSSKAGKKKIKDGSSTASSSKATVKNIRDGSSTASSSKPSIKKSKDGSSTASSSKASSKKTKKPSKHLRSKDVKCSCCATPSGQAKNGNRAPKK